MHTAFTATTEVARPSDEVRATLTDWDPAQTGRGPLALLAPLLRGSLRRTDGSQREALRAVVEAPR